MNGIKFGISLVSTILIVYLLNSSWVTPFRIGYFFSPFHGFWQNASSEVEGSNESFNLKGLKGSVEVITDENLVPHIFANSDEDAAYVQGYITARDRFWQMDFQVRAAAGRLSEVVGSKALPIDKDLRGKGLAWAAEKAVKEMEQEPQTMAILKAYSEGVNAYLEGLKSSDYPLEFKLMDYQPEKWSPLKTALLLKYMANMLAFKNDDVAYTNLQKALGKEMFAFLYPENPIVKATIIPEGTTWNFENEHPVSSEGTATPTSATKKSFNKPKPKPKGPRRVVQPDGSILIIGARENTNNDFNLIAENQTFEWDKPEKGWGSNNWAVSPEKSANGAALLANDPHLGLGLPAIWYEVQLSTSEGNTYGVSIPGAPGIVIGFNDSIAWGVTNSERDVIDYYKLEYKDNTQQEYKKGKDWAVIDKRKEVYKVKGDADVVEEVRYTDFGPIINDSDLGDLAIRWVAHDPSNEALTFLKLNKAKNYRDYVEALKHYQCPAQNFVFASRSGDIAIWQQGKFPNKGQGQGVTVVNAADSASYWQHYIPQSHNPHIINPERGYVSSTNQATTDGSYPYYYHQNMVECFRNRRLNERLDSLRKVSVEDMKALQLDTYSLLAAEALPTMLADLDLNKLRAEQKIGYDSLKKWNYYFNKEYVSPSIFDVWWHYVQQNIWEDDLAKIKGGMVFPDEAVTLKLLRDSVRFKYYDDFATPDTEDRKFVVRKAYQQAVDSLKRFASNMEDWKWMNVKNTTIRHLARQITPFNHQTIPIGGNRGILNACSRYWGPSWRMVVSLGKEIEAYGIYPGGQSGNPGSPYYDNWVGEWANGNYRKLWFMRNANDTNGKVVSRETFKRG